MEKYVLLNGNEIPKMGLGTDSVLFVRKLRSSTNRYTQKFIPYIVVQ